MKHRKLRIAWSVAWGVMAVLLVALWMRSHVCTEYLERFIEINPMYGLGVRERVLNFPGGIEFEKEPYANVSIHLIYEHPRNWHLGSYPKLSKSIQGTNRLGFKWQTSQAITLIVIPHWCVNLLSSFVVVLPWITQLPLTSWRFSLRTLLVATTLVAVGLGLIVWATH